MAEGLDTCHTEITFSLPEFVWYGSPWFKFNRLWPFYGGVCNFRFCYIFIDFFKTQSLGITLNISKMPFLRGRLMRIAG